ncbi:MAG TPA: TrkA family potassium uptake protein [Nitrospirae bacterium]|nr:Ktr system potassium uptake protein A [bacterium BMS3Abin06]HDH11369.1 TrkA family potassium uptake protein [Nitrospirota bacterium]HDZ03366.1 TrkA family potassium uptake protein [Nitrospirota bacterium]
MKKQFAVIGLGRFGAEVALTLAANNCDVIAVDKDEARVRELADRVALSVELDATDEKALREAGVQNVDVAVVSIGENIEASILVLMLLKDMGIKNIIAKAQSRMHGRILYQLGVRQVVYPERDMARKVARGLIMPEFMEHIELSPEYSIVELPAPDAFAGKSILDAKLRTDYGVTVIAIKKQGLDKGGKELWNINPLPSDKIQSGDTMVVLGANGDIERLRKISPE